MLYDISMLKSHMDKMWTQYNHHLRQLNVSKAKTENSDLPQKDLSKQGQELWENGPERTNQVNQLTEEPENSRGPFTNMVGL